MRLFTGYLEHLRSRGKYSLQVGEVALGSPVPATVEAPDEWFERLKVCSGLRRGTAGQRRPFGREQGFLFLSRAGYEANREQLREIVERYNAEWPGEGFTWQAFNAVAMAHFDMVDECTRRHADKMAFKARQAAAAAQRA